MRYVPIYLALITGIAAGHSILKTDVAGRCVVEIDGIQVERSLGETWNSTEVCVKHTCELNDRGEPTEKTFREYCYLNCYNEYELIIREGQCCGECVQTKCKVGAAIYNVGNMWKSEDGCTFFECVSQPSVGTRVSSYKKSCPALPACQRHNIVVRDCCEYCNDDSAVKKNKENNRENVSEKEFIHNTDEINEILDPATYENHRCVRECKVGAEPMVCEYTFHIEWYETLSKACFDCPFNSTDCSRPHCIFADGMRRNVLVINRMMPGPMLQVCYGDTVIVDVVNKLMGESTTIHWHGMHMKDSPYMDGVPQVTQCPIAPHTTFRYTFRADHEGTHWWHSHIGVQRSDGALGALIVRKPIEQQPPSVTKLYEFDLPEHTLIIQDWEHLSAVATFSSFHHSIGDNKPQNLLINGKGKYMEPIEPPADGVTIVDVNTFKKMANGEILPSTEYYPKDVEAVNGAGVVNDPVKMVNSTGTQGEATASNHTDATDDADAQMRDKREYLAEAILTPLEEFHVTAGHSYRFRTINAGFLNCPIEISIDHHNITVIASDGWYFDPVEVSSLVTYAGERFDFVVNANQPIDNYWIRVRGLMDCDERFTKAYQVAVLRYEGAPVNLPSGFHPVWEETRTGLQMNALNRGTGLVESVSIAELTTLEEDDPRLLHEHADFKFYIYYDFYDKDNPHFNNPNLYSNTDVHRAENRFIGPQLNRITMKMPSMPLLVAKDDLDESKFCNESSLANMNIDCSVDFCECNHVLQVPLNATVELVLVDEGYRYDANHPFHLHGHGFKVVAMERLKPAGIDVAEIQALDDAGKISRRLIGSPMKDTVTVPDGGYTIIRFVADNPGYWIFHCHIEYHIEVGMALVFKVGDHKQMLSMPKDFPTCSNYMPRFNDSSDESSFAKHIEPVRNFVAVATLLLVLFNAL